MEKILKKIYLAFLKEFSFIHWMDLVYKVFIIS